MFIKSSNTISLAGSSPDYKIGFYFRWQASLIIKIAGKTGRSFRLVS